MCDKIRILWIQDTDDIPSTNLPSDLIPYFDVTTKTEDGMIYPVESMGHFTDVVNTYWFDHLTDILPVELIAVDYDLSKAQSADVVDLERLSTDFGELRSAESPPDKSEDEEVGASDLLDFDGLLIGVFYASIFHNHPVGFVPTTYKMASMPLTVSNFQTMSEKILGVDFGFAGIERSWENIVKAGVVSLRERIKNLWAQREIVLLPSELIALADGEEQEYLTIRTPHTERMVEGVRRLPIQGLFVDQEKGKGQSLAAQEWAEQTLDAAAVSAAEFRSAKDLAKILWDQYLNADKADLVGKREVLSTLALARVNGEPYDVELYEQLTQLFRAKWGKDGKSQRSRIAANWYDIRYGDYSIGARRWATLMIIVKLIKRFYQLRMQVYAEVESTIGESIDVQSGPVLEVNDVLLALYPVASSPIVLEWHEDKDPSSRGSNWSKALKDIAMLDVRQLLAGKGFRPDDRVFGISPAERNVLFGVTLEEDGMKETDWRCCSEWDILVFGRGDGTRA